MKSLISLLVLLLAVNIVDAQEVKKLSSFFPDEKTAVLVVGTFHFDYPGLDVVKTTDENKIDVLKEPKKSEVTELVNYIKKFRPTKIAIEAQPAWNATEKLRMYKKGEFRDKRDERYQLGMRIATELGVDTLYSIDASSFDGDLSRVDSAYVRNLFKDFDFQSDDKFLGMYRKMLAYDALLPAKMSLLDYLKYINSKESHNLGYGAYLVGDFKLDDSRGADIISIWWYNRNLRIFRKIQQITESSDDRILVLFGNGHASILRQLLECSPEYEFVEFDSLK